MENAENKTPENNRGESSENKSNFNFEEWLKGISSRLDNIEKQFSQPKTEPTVEQPITETLTVTQNEGEAVDPESDFDTYCKIHFDHKEIK